MRTQKEIAKCMTYYHNDRCFLVLVICMFAMFLFFFLQKEEIKKKPLGQNFVILFLLFLHKVGSVGPIDQQVNFFALSISIKIYLQSLLYHHHSQKYFFNWNFTSSSYLEILLINMIKLLFSFFSLIAMLDVSFCNFWRL